MKPKDVILFEEEEEEEETSQESSTEANAQDTDDASEEQSAGASEQTTEEQNVPYSRFKEVNERLKRESESKAEYERKLKEYEARLNQNQPQNNPQLDQVRKTLKELGYVTKEDMESELKREREDAQLNLELSRLENRYNGKDGLPKFKRQEVIDYAVERGISDPEVAYRQMNFDKIIDYHVKNASGKTQSVKSEKSDGSGSSQAGVPDGDLREAVAKGDNGALHTLLKRMASSRPDSQ